MCHSHFSLGPVHTELLAIALALVVIAKNGYVTFFAFLSLRAQCEQNLSISDAKNG